MDVADQILEKISESLNSLSVIDGSTLKHFTAALKELRDIKGVRSDADIREQEIRMENLRKSEKNPVILGWHWIGSEHEVWNDAFDRRDLQERYDFFFDRMLASMGQHCPLWLYKLNAEHFCQTHNIKLYASENINKALWWQAQRHPDVHMVRPDRCPWWDASQDLRGIYAPDDAHYLPKVQQWFAEEFYRYVREHYTF